MSELFWTRRPELERSWADPPPELGLSSPPPGEGAGAVVGGGYGVLGTVGVVGTVGVSGTAGAWTGVPGSWMSSSEAPGGTSTVTGTTSPVASRT
ncbi:MAG: hypothetical protein ABW142_05370 [Thermoleophilaceae bacterium]